MSQEYESDIISSSVLGETIVILNSRLVMSDLLDKRAVNANRPQIQMIRLMGLGNVVKFSRYGPRWRQLRKAIHQGMQESAIYKYWPTQQTEARNRSVRARRAITRPRRHHPPQRHPTLGSRAPPLRHIRLPTTPNDL